MKRKVFTLLMAFLTTVGNAVWAENISPSDAKKESPFDLSEESATITSGGEYWIKCSSQTDNGIVVSGCDPTIYLVGININVSGSAIEIKNTANPTFVLIGENKITSAGNIIAHTQSKAAIDIASLSSMTISEESTGVLEIEMTSDRGGEQVAIGAGGTGRASDSGSLTVNGGTIVTNGYLGGFYNHAFRMGYDEDDKPLAQGSGLVFAKDIVTEGKGNWLISNGMYSESEAGSGERTAVVAGNNVILKSPIPERCKVSVATNDGKSTTLTIDEGKSYKKSQIEVGEGGTLNAYEVTSYTNSNPDDITVAPTSFPTDEYLGGHKELGKFTTINPDNYYFWGWLNDKEIITATGETPEGIEKLDLKGVWVVKSYTTEVEKNGDVSVNMVVPSEAASLVDITLPTGNKDWTLNEDTKVISGNVGEKDVTLKVTVGEDKEATLTFKVEDDGQGGDETTDISKTGYTIDNAKLKDFAYQAKDLTDEVKNAIAVEDKGGKVLEASNYEVTINPERVLNAGEYKVTVTGKGDYSGSIEATFTVAKAKLSATASEVKVAVNGTPDFSEVTFTFNEGSKPYTGDEVSVKLNSDGPTVDTSTESSQEYTYKNVELTGSAKDNYELTEVKGTITVGDSGEEPGTSTDITTGYVIENDKLKDLVYKAEDLDVEIIVKNSQTGEVLDAKNYSVEITPKQIYDAGKYTVKVTGKDGYSGSFEGSFEVAQKEVIAAASTIECEINPGDLDYKEEVEFTFDTNPEFGGVYEKDKDQVWVVWDGAKPMGDFNLGAAGSYKVTYSDATLGGDQAKNYKLAADPTGNIVVGKPQGGDDEDKTDINDVEAFIKYHEKIFVYNGEEQDPTYLVVVKDKDGGSEYTDDVDYTVSILDENGEAADFIKAGDYTLVVTPTEKGRLKGDPITLDEKLPIYPREVKVVAKDIYYTIGNEEGLDMKDLFSFAESEEEHEGLVASDEGALAVTADQPSLKDYTTPGTYPITYTHVTLIGSAAGNYKLGTDVTGKVIVKKELTGDETLQPGSPDDKDAEITLGDAWVYDNGRYKQVYDGKDHPIESLFVKVNGQWQSVSTEDFKVTGDVGSIKDAGEYNVTIELDNEYYKCKVDLKLWINQKELIVDLNLPTEVESDEDLASSWSVNDAKFEGEVANEEGKGKIKGEFVVVSTDGGYATVKIEDLALDTNSPFLPHNYFPVYRNNGKDVTIDESGDVTISGIKIVNSDPGKAEDLKPGESGWASTDGKHFYRVYDGKEHAVTSISVNGENKTEGFTVDYNGADKVKDAGTYLATVTFTDGKYAPTTMVLTILQRPMEITFDLPETIKEGETLDIHALIRYQQMGEDCGLIETEGEPVIKSGQLVVTAPYDNGKCAVILKDFLLEKNESGFNPANYGLKVWNATINDWAAYENDGDDPDITLTDPTNPDEENPNGEGGSGITVDDGDDDNPDNPGTDPDEPGTDPDEPGTDPDDPTTDPDDPTKPEWPINPGQGGSTSTPYYKHYNVLIEDVCDGIELSASRYVVREGNQVHIYMKIEEGCDTTGMKLEYKRGLFGTWDDLKLLESVQSGEYIIKHIYTDIYVRATGAKMDGSATGIEDLGDAQTKVYTQDGRIYVYAPERADVQIVNMAGVVVQRSEQIGLQAYDRLNPGIYIVRVGDEVFKVKL